MKITKNAHRKQASFCKTLAKLSAAGLACAAVLVASPVRTLPSGGNADSAGLWDCVGDGTDKEEGIMPLNDDDIVFDREE